MTERVHLNISGLVQGVMFRAFVQSHARRLGVVGWVRNTRNGAVEVTAEGERSALEKLVELCRHGPPHARVTDVDVQWQSATGEFQAFRVTY